MNVRKNGSTKNPPDKPEIGLPTAGRKANILCGMGRFRATPVPGGIPLLGPVVFVTSPTKYGGFPPGTQSPSAAILYVMMRSIYRTHHNVSHPFYRDIGTLSTDGLGEVFFYFAVDTYNNL